MRKIQIELTDDEASILQLALERHVESMEATHQTLKAAGAPGSAGLFEQYAREAGALLQRVSNQRQAERAA